MNEVICPITFINKAPTASSDINNIFMNPYKDTISRAYIHGVYIDEVKDNCHIPENTIEVKGSTNSVQSGYNRSVKESVEQYLIMNITDLTINTIYRFVDSLIEKSNVGEMLDKEHALNIGGVLFAPQIDANYIRDKISDPVYYYIHLSDTNSEFTRTLALVSNDQLMSMVYSRVVSEVFDKLIVDHVMYAFNTKEAGKELYDWLYSICYPDSEEVEYMDIANSYSFCTGSLRELFEPLLYDYRCALTYIGTNATLMLGMPNREAFNPDNLMDPNYSTSREVLMADPTIGDIIKDSDVVKSVTNRMQIASDFED